MMWGYFFPGGDDERPLDVELHAIEMKPGYTHAIRRREDFSSSSSSRYVHSLHLMLLRADGFDVQKAALHLVKFFEAKLCLFGSEALLEQPIRLSHLDYDDILSL